jgi:hypothetical protein
VGAVVFEEDALSKKWFLGMTFIIAGVFLICKGRTNTPTETACKTKAS